MPLVRGTAFLEKRQVLFGSGEVLAITNSLVEEAAFFH